jgi:hypothetical protein
MDATIDGSKKEVDLQEIIPERILLVGSEYLGLIIGYRFDL